MIWHTKLRGTHSEESQAIYIQYRLGPAKETSIRQLGRYVHGPVVPPGDNGSLLRLEIRPVVAHERVELQIGGRHSGHAYASAEQADAEREQLKRCHGAGV